MTSIDDRVSTVLAAFLDQYGRAPVGVWAAPGRVNVLGEHTDYNDGFVLPMALEQSCIVAAAPTGKDQVSTVRSLQKSDEAVSFSASDVAPGEVDDWAAYVAGAFWAIRGLGRGVDDLDLLIDSDVPVGAGLSSSAALECATATMLVDLAGETVGAEPSDRTSIALAAQRVENDFVGVPTGSMDQLVSMHGRLDHLTFIDIRSLTVIQVPFELSTQGLALLVINTMAPHSLVDSEYADRRHGCEAAARHLGVDALRDVQLDDLADAERALEDPQQRAYMRHVVTENSRVLDVVRILASGGDPREIGPALTASHASMRDDYRITVPRLDVAVDAALAAGAYGARMTGGGFGGCAIALVDSDSTGAVAAAVERAFAENDFGPPEHFVAIPSDGARRLR